MFDKSSTAKRHCSTWLGVQPTRYLPLAFSQYQHPEEHKANLGGEVKQQPTTCRNPGRSLHQCITHSKSQEFGGMHPGYASHSSNAETALVIIVLRPLRLEVCSLSINIRKRCAECASLPPLPILQLCPCLSQTLFAPQKGGRATALSFWSKVVQYGCRKRDEAVRSAISHFELRSLLLLPIA